MTPAKHTAPGAADRAYRLTKELVLTGELPGGHLFSEGEIAERLGVSRTPVREAFLRLQVEGLLNLIPKRGAVVVPVPPGEAEDVLDAREAVEGAAVRRLVRRPDLIPDALEQLRAVLGTQRGHAEAGDLHGFAEADELFHRTIVAAGGNALLLDFYATLADRQRRMNVHALRPVPTLLPVVLREHEDLLTIIERADADAFGPALRAHLDQVHRR
ncbi:GntR family transcriptional regulator [Amycolatopsis sp. FDAARGOS 1241]|uniref:GntR family transcriptional regulator n=1 Tax=Amycolatopsis sp. FDAARGOS 1241 TaxID=2778070 RepID=UPI0019510425|nr:GntR family transcriptional regulator [Amycolatopsis sp. FDAARGOS 1241]QRP43539.1 GntR family transcriptional regulator [Amycolatopsis sp. FDAARGOS 1241]